MATAVRKQTTGVGPTTSPAVQSPTGPTANPYEEPTRRTQPTVRINNTPAPVAPAPVSAGNATSGNRAGVSNSQQQWDDAWMNSPAVAQQAVAQPTGGTAVAKPNTSLGTAVPRTNPPNSDPNARRAGGTGVQTNPGGVGPSTPPAEEETPAEETPVTPTYFRTQPTVDDISKYYQSRGIAPQGNSLQYWVNKFPELMARGRQLNPSGDGSDYFNKWLSNAEEFTGGPRQTAEAMWGPGAYDRFQAQNNPTPQPQGIAPTQTPQYGNTGTNDALMTAFLEYLMNQQPQTTQPLNRTPTQRSATQIRMGM